MNEERRLVEHTALQSGSDPVAIVGASLTASSGLQISIAAAIVLTNFNGAGVGFGFGAGCGFGVGWGFGGTPLNFLGLGVGGGCGVGLGLGWGFGTAFGSQYHSSGVTFQGIDFGKKEHNDAVRQLFITQFPHHFRPN